jgi:hypothetical protein
VKSLTKSKKQKLAAVGDAKVEVALPVAGVLNDVRSAFFGLCVNAGKAVLMAMMEEERAAVCGAKGVPHPMRSAYRGGHTQPGDAGWAAHRDRAATRSLHRNRRSLIAQLSVGHASRSAGRRDHGGDCRGRIDAPLRHNA